MYICVSVYYVGPMYVHVCVSVYYVCMCECVLCTYVCACTYQQTIAKTRNNIYYIFVHVKQSLRINDNNVILMKHE